MHSLLPPMNRRSNRHQLRRQRHCSKLPATSSGDPNPVFSGVVAVVLAPPAAVVLVVVVDAHAAVASPFAGRPSWPIGQSASPGRPALCARAAGRPRPFSGAPGAEPPCWPAANLRTPPIPHHRRSSRRDSSFLPRGPGLRRLRPAVWEL